MGVTESQQKAINIIDSNCQIVACAGSGKTTTMVAKIMNMVTKGNLLPENIVAITYTEKAADSLKQKIYKEYQEKFGNIQGLANMYIGTIHGYCLFLLQEFTDEYKNYEILNDVQTRLFMKRKRKVNGLSDVIYHPKKGAPYNLINEYSSNEIIQNAIKAYKNFLDIAREYGVENLHNPDLVECINKYEKTLKDNKYFDFTSILVKTQNLLNQRELDEYITHTIKHMIIDEYQDVNDAQENIIRYFYNHGTKICVVGDDDQTIYHWRGSKLKYIKEFDQRYANVEKVDLDINFRSSIGITEVAKKVISNNVNRIPKDMKSNNSQKYESGDILVKEFDTRDEEVNFIISKIKQLLGSEFTIKDKKYGLDLDDMVILVSSVKKVPELLDKLQENNIEFLVEGTQKLFEAKEIILLCKTFDLLFDIPDLADDEIETYIEGIDIDSDLVDDWKEFINLSDGEITSVLKGFVKNYVEADQYDYTIQENLKQLFVGMRLFDQKIDDKVLYNWGEFTEIINDFEKINLLLQPWYKMQAFKSFLKEDAPLIYPEGWLSPNFKTIRCLRIMTYHQSKGLEYPVVFMPCLTKNAIFPMKTPGGINAWGIFNDDSIRTSYDNDEESNRRLFYVGITRSEKYLFMTRSDVEYGNRGRKYNMPAQPLVEAKNSIYVEQSTCLDKTYEKCSDKKFSNDEVITLNFSLLKDLFDCPQKFKMLNVYSFSQPLSIRMGYGKSIHNMLDYIHRNYRDLNLSDEKVVENIAEEFLYLPYGSEKLQEAMSAKAKLNLKSYVRNNMDKFDHIIFSEKTIDYSMNDYLFINGRIDLVRDDLHKKTGIVDFKSSSEVLTKEQIKNQLMIYVLGYEHLTADKVDYIESYDFNHGNPTVIEVTDEEKRQFEHKLTECQDIIKSGNFQRITAIDKTKDRNYCKGIDCTFINSCFPKK